MRLESKKYLYDIARASELAMQFIAGKSFADYGSSAMLRSAVERQLEIVGKALAQLARIDPGRRPRGSANLGGSLLFVTYGSCMREVFGTQSDDYSTRPDGDA
jgi:hypothetical protein